MIVRRIDPEHIYLVEDGRRPVGVTTVLGGERDGRRQRWEGVQPWSHRFDHVAPEVLEAAARRGTAVHLARHYDDERLPDGRSALNEETLDPEVLGYLEGWRRFRAEAQFVPRHSELVVYHEAYGYAGTLDALGTMAGRKALVDVKTGSDQDADLAGPQTIAYLDAARAMQVDGADGLVLRCSVHLRPNGTYRVVPHNDDRGDREWFRGVLIAYRKFTERR